MQCWDQIEKFHGFCKEVHVAQSNYLQEQAKSNRGDPFFIDTDERAMEMNEDEDEDIKEIIILDEPSQVNPVLDTSDESENENESEKNDSMTTEESGSFYKRNYFLALPKIHTEENSFLIFSIRAMVYQAE